MARLLDEIQWDILTFVEEFYNNKGKFPEISHISRKLPYPQEVIVDKLSDPLMKQSLEVRGISYLEDDRLTPEQLAAVNLVLNVSDKRTITQKLDALGVKVSTYNGWKKQKHFMEYARSQAESLFGENMPEVHKALVDSAIAGDPKALKLYYGISGRYNERDNKQIDVRVVMIRMLETIQKHVRDPAVLESIANEFQDIMAAQVIQGQLES